MIGPNETPEQYISRLESTNAELFEALKGLLDELIEYAFINDTETKKTNPATRQAMRKASAAIARVYGFK